MKNFTLKTLLMSVLLCVGGSAWADQVVFDATKDVAAGAQSYQTTEISYTATDGSVWKANGHGATKETNLIIGKGGANYLETPKVDGVITSVAVTWSGNTSYYLALQTTTGTELEAKSNPSTPTTDTFTISSGSYSQLRLVGRRSSGTSNAAATITKVVVTYTPNAVDTRKEADLSYSEETAEATIGQSFTAPTLNNPNGLTVTYKSSDTEVATVDESGNITLVGGGETTITASSEATETYKAGEASYTLTVTDPFVSISSLVFEDECGGVGTADDGVSWTVESDGTESTYEDDRGIHYGTSKSVKVKYITLKTSDIDGLITKIVVNASTASDVSAVLNVTVGGNDFGTQGQAASQTATNYTFTDSASGEIVVTLTKSESAYKALYVKSITVTYTPSYTRSVTNGNYGTLCLPFGVDEEGISGATFYTISSKTMDGEDVKFISLEEATSLTAGVGYLFQASADEIHLLPNGTNVTEPVTGGALVGTFTDDTAIPNNMYMLSSNKLYKTVEDYGKMNAFRAYIDLSKVDEVSEAKGRILFADGYDEATGIKGIATDAADDAAIYNVAGQRVNAAYKGIVIKNGKKYLNK